MTKAPDDFIALTRRFVEAVKFDEHGRIVAGRFVGGNGGLISRETLQLADEIEVALNALEGK